MTPREVAALFGVNVSTLGVWARADELPSVRTPGGHRRYRSDDVKKLLSNRQPERSPERMEMEEDAVRLYEEGWSIRQVAQRFECGYSVMRRILVRHAALRERR
jgi:excisionase family DNA binding protein